MFLLDFLDFIRCGLLGKGDIAFLKARIGVTAAVGIKGLFGGLLSLCICLQVFLGRGFLAVTLRQDGHHSGNTDLNPQHGQSTAPLVSCQCAAKHSAQLS